MNNDNMYNEETVKELKSLVVDISFHIEELHSIIMDMKGKVATVEEDVKRLGDHSTQWSALLSVKMDDMMGIVKSVLQSNNK